MSELQHAGQFVLRVDEDNDRPFWEGAFEGDKEGSRIDAHEGMTLYPFLFPPGTMVEVFEPEDSDEFYEKLFEESESPPRTIGHDGAVAQAGLVLRQRDAGMEVARAILDGDVETARELALDLTGGKP